MSVIIQEKNANFTKIANELITDSKLSAGAKVLYCYLRSKPNNWKVINSDIMKTLQISEETIAKYFKDLLVAGWIERKRETNEKGQFSGKYEYTIKESPKATETVSGKKPYTEKYRIRKNTVYGELPNT